MIVQHTSKGGDPADLPLFYKAPVVVCLEHHRDAGLAGMPEYGFCRDAAAIPIVAGEFPAAMRHYPIVFAMDEQASPLALVGIRKGHNLFIERDGGWRSGSYLPAYVRRYPFIVLETPEGGQLLTIDQASERFTPAGVEQNDDHRIFDAQGQPTQLTRSAMDFCFAFQIDHTHTVTFAQALKSAGLLMPYHADFRLPDGARHLIDGFHAVNEKAFRALPADTVADWHVKGWLALVNFHLASMHSFQNLLDLNAQRATERKALA
ncbi:MULTISPECIES: SapC family protein [unclassified Rhizobium]|uniref:SapC family protein n=1 Tax=unclassified Rhizobium TaxID=2613769 RepID=UPI0038102EAD